MKKSNIIKSIVLIVLIVLVIRLIFFVFARFESVATSIGQIDIALYIINEDYQSMNVFLDEMIPREEPYLYNFTIANFNNAGVRSDIDIEYTLIIRTTTNLPLIFELYLNEAHDDLGATNIITSNTVVQDEYGTFFRIMTMDPEQFGTIEDEINFYQLVVFFPGSFNTQEYQNIIEGIEIRLESVQIM